MDSSGARARRKACINALERLGGSLGMVADIPFGEKGHRVSLCGSWTRRLLCWGHGGDRRPRTRHGHPYGFVLREKPGQYRIVFHDPILPQ